MQRTQQYVNSGWWWLLAMLLAVCPSLQAQTPAVDYMAGRVTMRLKPAYRGVAHANSVAAPDVALVLQRYGATVAKRFPQETPPDLRALKANPRLVDLSLVYNVYFSPAHDPRAVARALAALSSVQYAEPEYIAHPLFTPNDGNYPSWIAQLRMEQAWALNQGDTNVVIGIIDSGVKWDHPDLQGNMKFNWADPVNGVDDDNDGYLDNFAGWDFVGTDGRIVNGTVAIVPDNEVRPQLTDVPVGSSVTSTIGHGTWVTGYAAASTNNGTGVPSTGFNCKFLPIKLMHDWNGGGLYFTTDAIYYAATHGARVMNLSLGSNNFSRLQQDVVNFATFNQDCAVVAAAGNGISEQYVYPASYDNVLSVTTFGLSDEIQNAYGKRVDVGAFGNGLTTNISDSYQGVPGGNYTSLSSPLAAGIVGLIRAHFPSLTALQAIERARVTADDVYAANPNPLYARMLGKGRLNAFSALTQQVPAIRNVNWQVNDGADNVPDPGNVIWLTGTYTNYLNPATNLTISVATSDPHLTIQSASVNAGDLATLQNFTIANNGLRLLVSAAAPVNHTADLVFLYQSGTYTDYEHISIVLNPSYQDISSTMVSTAVGSDAKWGQNSYTPNPWQGPRFRLGEYNDYLWEGSLLLGSDANTCANNMRTGSGGRADHFTSLQKPTKVLNPAYSDEEVVLRFSDAGLGANAQGINVEQRAYGFQSEAYGNLIIFRYTLENTEPFTIPDLHLALAADWDLETNVLRDTARYDAARRMLYAYGVENASNREGCLAHMGMVLLSDHFTPNARTLNVATFGFGSQLEKFGAISSGTGFADANGIDVLQVLGAGPFDLLPLGKQEVAFAIIGACSYAELLQVADTARSKFACMFKETALSLDLGSDVAVCNSITLNGTVPGAVRYQWTPTTLGTNPVQTFSQSGIYTLTAFDADDCPYSDEVVLTVVAPPAPSIQLPLDTINLAEGQVLSVDETAQGISGWQWNFGDGYGFQGKTGTHTYLEPGTYELRLITTNGVCVDTAYREVAVVYEPATARTRVATTDTRLTVYPNPAGAGQVLQLLHPQLEQGQPAQLQLLDYTGKLVLAQPMATVQHSGVLLLQLPSLSAGVYMLRVQQGGLAHSARLMVR
jgi:serine protease